VKIDVQLGGCNIFLPPQNDLATVTYTNVGNQIKVDHALSGVTYTTERYVPGGTSNLCGPGGTNGTFTGSDQMEKVGGARLWWHA
jgi:hypothetical protein